MAELTAEEVQRRRDEIETGKVILHSVAELTEQFGDLLPEAIGALAEWAGPISAIVGVIEMIYETIKASGEEQQGAGYRGIAYGTVWAALDMGVPHHTCSGSTKGPEEDQLDTDAWNKGAGEAAAKVQSDPVARNRVVIRIAHEGGDPGRTVNAIFQELCVKGDNHLLAQLYPSLSWPGPE